jgi:hypothetical protein
VKSYWISAVRGTALTVAAFVLFHNYSAAQDASTAAPGADAASLRDLQEQIRELRSLVEEMRTENVQSRAEMQQLRHDLEATRALLERPAPSTVTAVRDTTPSNADSQTAPVMTPATAAQNPSELEQRVQKLEESTSLMGSKVDEQYQTKVETASKYRARLHGIVLMNAFRNVGGADSVDSPTYAVGVPSGIPSTNVGATFRQSEIGIEVFGPRLAGAKTSADIQFDFSGGFPQTGNGVDFGIMRMQTASLRMDWEHTSLVAGQDSLFISPLSPSSFASLATPSFASTGNLWGWIPQVRLEHRFAVSDQQTLTLQAGVLDSVDWQFPFNSFYRAPQAGEQSGQPAYAFRTAWSRPLQGHALSFGAAGFYARQDWAWGRYIDSWSGMADWQIPLVPRLTLSGEFYRGRGIGGLGGGISTTIIYGGDPQSPATPIRPVDAAGGWAQLKFQLTPKLELNGVVGDDNVFPGNIRGFASDANNYGPILGRNEAAMGNFIFRPRSDLVLSAEFKRYRTFPIYSSLTTLNQVSLSAGILF